MPSGGSVGIEPGLFHGVGNAGGVLRHLGERHIGVHDDQARSL